TDSPILSCSCRVTPHRLTSQACNSRGYPHVDYLQVADDRSSQGLQLQAEHECRLRLPPDRIEDQDRDLGSREPADARPRDLRRAEAGVTWPRALTRRTTNARGTKSRPVSSSTV